MGRGVQVTRRRPIRRASDAADPGSARADLLFSSTTMSLTAAQKGKGRALPMESSNGPALLHSPAGSEYEVDSDSASDSGDETSSASSSSAASDSDSDSDGSITSEYMQSLLEKARQNARALKKLAPALSAREEEEEVIHLISEPQLCVHTTSTYDPCLGCFARDQLPSLDPGSLPEPYITPGTSRQAGPSKIRDPEVERTEKISSTLSAPAAPAPPRDELTKKQRNTVRNLELPRKSLAHGTPS